MWGRGARWLLGLTTALIATLGALALRRMPAVALWDQRIVEAWRPSLDHTGPCEIVAITGATFAKLGASADSAGMNRVSTELIPRLVASLEKAGAKALAIDLIYETPRADSEDAISREYRRKNRLLREALARHRGLPVALVLGYSDVTPSDFSIGGNAYTWEASPIDPGVPHVHAGHAISAANAQYAYPLLDNPLTGKYEIHVGVLMAARASADMWYVAPDGVELPNHIVIGGRSIPIDGSGAIPIRYPSDPSAFRTTELIDAIETPERFRGKLVFLGTVGDVEDRHGTKSIDGVYTCAAIAATLLDKAPAAPPILGFWWIALAAAIGGVLGALSARRGNGRDLLIGMIAAVGSGLLIHRLNAAGIPLGPFVPLTSFALSALGTLALVAVAFTPRAIKADAPVEEPIEGAFLFVDLVGSTRLSGTMTPVEFARLVSEIVTRSSDAVRRAGGEVANPTGDGILAYFRGKKADPIAGIRACRRALAGLTAGGRPLQFTYGLEWGHALLKETRVGDRLDRALSGEAVNRAAKLQEICPNLDIDVAIGPEFATRMSLPGVLRQVGTAQLSSGAGKTIVWTLEP